MTPTPVPADTLPYDIEHCAMNIVFQMGDELCLSVAQRQATNDLFINFAKKLIAEVVAIAKAEGVKEGERKERERIHEKFYTGHYNLNGQLERPPRTGDQCIMYYTPEEQRIIENLLSHPEGTP